MSSTLCCFFFRNRGRDRDRGDRDRDGGSQGGGGLLEGRFEGNIKSFNQEKGFGFVDCPEARAKYGRDVFVHKAMMKQGHLEVGDAVSFIINIENKDGMPQAAELFRLDSTDPQIIDGKGREDGKGKGGKGKGKGKGDKGGKGGKDGKKGNGDKGGKDGKGKGKGKDKGGKSKGAPAPVVVAPPPHMQQMQGGGGGDSAAWGDNAGWQG